MLMGNIMKNILITLLILLGVEYSFACINGETKELKNGLTLYEEVTKEIPRGDKIVYLDSVELEALAFEMDSLYQLKKDVAYLSDLGVAYIFMGQYERARQLYLDIEKMEAGRYSTASNLGTVYELLGKNEKALKWIQQSVEISPTSHFSSEWIHVNILKVKVRKTKVNSQILLGVDFGQEELPQTNLSKEELEKLYKALFFQLNERAFFIKEPDPIMAQLYFDMANIAAILEKEADASSLYQLAKNYGMESKFFEKRYALASRKLAKYKEEQALKKREKAAKATALSLAVDEKRFNYWIPITLGLLLLLFGCGFLFFRKG